MQSSLFQPSLNRFVKWLSNKENTLSLHFKKSASSPSSSSYISSSAQSIIIATESSNNNKENNNDDDIHLLPPPPAYNDTIHPWVFEFPDYLKARKVYPREEEGNEIIPEYQCTVQKTEPSISMKFEKMKPNIRAKDRAWRNIYLELRGTMMMIYNKRQQNKDIPLWSQSMEGAKVSRAKDYAKYRHVIRVSLNDGRQFLLRMQSDKHSAEWIALIESSVNICTDLDQRLMPKFNTLPNRHRAGH